MSTKKEINGVILILSCQKHKDTRLKEINLKNKNEIERIEVKGKKKDIDKRQNKLKKKFKLIGDGRSEI
jgi:hypothetical protein